MRYLKLIFPTLLLAAWAFAFLQRKTGRFGRVLLLAVSFLVICALPPVAWVAARTLEWRYLNVGLPPVDADAIVVLSGGGWAAEGRQPYSMPSIGTVLRCRHAAWLYGNWKQTDVLVSGPRFSIAPNDPPGSEDMARLLVGWGVPASRILFENEGRSTAEEAARVAQILRSRGVRKPVLVTEAYHMQRSEAAFRKQGMAVFPSPCGFVSTPARVTPIQLLPSTAALDQNEHTFREWVVLVYYGLRGRI